MAKRIRKPRSSTRDIAQEITDKIVAALEAGTNPWQRPWSALGVTGRGQAMPHNATTGKAYRGINVSLLMLEQQAGGFTSSGWLTFNQAKAAGGMVRKGSKGTAVVFWKFLKKTETDPDTGEKKDHRFPMMRHYTVFNVEQVDGLPERIASPEGEEIEAIPDLAEWVAETLGCRVQHGGDRAFYAPGHDLIQLPNRGQFKSEEGYNGTLLHEATHCTGSKSRLDRLTSAGFGSQDYAKEELTAEMGASMLCATLGLDYEVEHHASYIGSWLKALKEDKRYVIQAASKAQQALDYIMTEAGMIEEEEPEEIAEAA